MLDRSLLPEEEERLEAGDALDLRESAPAASSRARDAVLDWIDAAYGHTFDGQSMDAYFGVGGRSYWLNVRFRLFHDLYADALLLDRLSHPDVLDRIRTVYCDAQTEAFWRHWAPQARRVTVPRAPEPEERPSTLRELVRRYVVPAPSRLRALRRARRMPWSGVFFSSSAYNVPREDGLWDRQFGPLFDRYPDETWLRVEYEPLPRKGLRFEEEGPRDGPRLHPTLSTDAILAGYLLRRPFATLRLVRHHRALQRRFARPLARSHAFPFRDAAWGARLHGIVRGLAPSIALFHLLQDTFGWFLADLRPEFALVTGESNSIGRLFVEAARGEGLPAFGIQHGYVLTVTVDYRLSEAESGRAAPDRFFCWGDETRRYLVERSHFPPDRVHAVGRLLSDTLLDVEPDPQVRAFGRERGKPVLFFASQPQPYTRNRRLSAGLLAAFCRLHGLCCVVKLHPREADDGLYARAFAAEGAGEDLLLHAGPVHPMIAASDYAATCYSTVAWEIMSLERPLLIFDPMHLNLLHLRARPSVYHADLEAGSFEAWRRGKDEHVRSNVEWARDVVGPVDGRVAERIRRILPPPRAAAGVRTPGDARP